MPVSIAVEDESAWRIFRDQWSLRPDTIYLNHGSFGPPPIVVQQARSRFQQALDAQPMDFFTRQLEPQLDAVRGALGEFVGAAPEKLALVDNATYAMNIVAESVPLAHGDEVLLTNHEYGAVKRIWQRACDRAGATVRTVDLPDPIESVDQVVAAVAAGFNGRTRLLVVSHITSPTAVTLPVAELCDAARAAGVAVCIDGPHAVAQIPLAIEQLGCDFYAASCHKWLSAPFGSGFLYAHPRWHELIQPPILSWGNTNLPIGRRSWRDEFNWSGTRDTSALLAIGSAIDFLRDVGLEPFRQRTQYLASYARRRLLELTG
ncbi:MAG: aminotransferase class V-fold PLP-dependent enzyme, partial [Planctomycetales bacterium]|nr:aminotransferase class V-fold PLP-dependent enzyme [Planctomycetales bacterium]